MMANNTLERAVSHRGRTVRAVALLRGPVRSRRRCAAAQLGR
jgi:hypothetical protein